MISAEDIPNGTHFWAKFKQDGQIAVFIKDGANYFVCGGWECSIDEEQFEVIEIIPFPAGLTVENLYYL